MAFQLVLTTCPDEKIAKTIAEHLVKEELAAKARLSVQRMIDLK